MQRIKSVEPPAPTASGPGGQGGRPSPLRPREGPERGGIERTARGTPAPTNDAAADPSVRDPARPPGVPPPPRGPASASGSVQTARPAGPSPSWASSGRTGSEVDDGVGAALGWGGRQTGRCGRKDPRGWRPGGSGRPGRGWPGRPFPYPVQTLPLEAAEFKWQEVRGGPGGRRKGPAPPPGAPTPGIRRVTERIWVGARCGW